MQQLRFSTSAAAADGLTRDCSIWAAHLVRQLRCGSDPLEPLADFLTAMSSPDAAVVGAAAAAAGAVEVLEKLMRGEAAGREEGAVQALAAAAMTRLIPHSDGCGAALARFITVKGAVVIGAGRGCSGAAALKTWRIAGQTCASVLAEGRRAPCCVELCECHVTFAGQLRRGLPVCKLRWRASVMT